MTDISMNVMFPTTNVKFHLANTLTISHLIQIVTYGYLCFLKILILICSNTCKQDSVTNKAIKNFMADYSISQFFNFIKANSFANGTNPTYNNTLLYVQYYDMLSSRTDLVHIILPNYWVFNIYTSVII